MHIRWEVVIFSTNLEWRRYLAQILTANEIEYAYASSLEECKEIVARESVGLIFWDNYLADESCQHLLHSIWSLDPRVKIVVISHVNDSNEHLANAQTEAFGVLPFPCQPTDVEWVLSRAIHAEREDPRSEQHRVQQLRM
jgi:DNA-binding NtrC family response regulator